MEITKIKMNYKDDPVIKAYFSITFNNCLTLNNCSILASKESGEKFIYYPFKKLKDGTLFNLARPITPEFRNIITKKVFDLYDNKQIEYTNSDINTEFTITDCCVKIINPDDNAFNVKIVLDNMFLVNNILIIKKRR